MLQSSATARLRTRPRALSSPSILQSSTASASRSFCFNRRQLDWSSQLDPMYYRFTRYRSLKTRAKLLATIKRRSKFDWDVGNHPFLTSKQLRTASHWGCHPRGGRWMRFHDSDDFKTSKATDAEKQSEIDQVNEDEVALSRKEKKWKEWVEAYKKRVEADPYEAVFGKRPESFWSPLLPSWMRDELGLHHGATAQNEPKNGKYDIHPRSKSDNVGQTESKVTQPPVWKRMSDTSPSNVENTQSAVPESYTSYSSTSWDSWTQEAQRTTWDSISGQTKRFVYDPVSNRMVQVVDQEVPAKTIQQGNAPAPCETSQQVVLEKSSPKTGKPVDSRPDSLVSPASRVGTKSLADIVNLTKNSAIDASSRKRDVKLTRPAQLAKLPSDDIDLLTADSIRAGMGKMRSSAKIPSTREKAELEKSYTDVIARQDAEYLAAVSKPQKSNGRERSRPSTWLSAFLENGELSVEPSPSIKASREEGEKSHQSSTTEGSETPRLQTSLERRPKADHRRTSPTLQSALERMQSKELLVRDDYAAITNELPSSVPKGWDDQASLLQADRIQRTASKLPYPSARWNDDIQARRVQYERDIKSGKAERSVRDITQQQRNIRAQEILDAEVSNQKFMMAAHEGKWAHHLAPKADGKSKFTAQSPDAVASGTVGQETDPIVIATQEQQRMKDLQGEGDFDLKVTKFARADDKWYKQPTHGPPAEKLEQSIQKANDQALVQEVRRIYEDRYGVIDSKHQQPAPPSETKAVHEEAALNSALLEQEADGQYRFKKDNLEAELASKSTGQDIVNQPAVSKSDIRVQTEAAEFEYSNGSDSKNALQPQWAQPPLYRILHPRWAKDDMTTEKIIATTIPSTFPGYETPVSIPEAFRRLWQPSRFTTQLAKAQQDGYQVVYASNIVIVLRKLAPSEIAKFSAFADLWKESTPAPVPESNGKSRDKRDFGSDCNESGGLDGSLYGFNGLNNLHHDPQHTFGNQDGHFNHEPMSLPNKLEPEATERQPPFTQLEDLLDPKQQNKQHGKADKLTKPSTTPASHMVKRKEHIFTGTQRVSSVENDSTANKEPAFADQDTSASLENSTEKPQKADWRRAFWRRTLLGGAGLVGTSYLVGVAVEAKRRDDVDRAGRLVGDKRWRDLVEKREGKGKWWM